MSGMKYAIIFLLLFFCSKNSEAQNVNRVIDSLLTVLKTAKEDTTKVDLLVELSKQHRIAGDLKKARNHADSAMTLSRQINYRKGEANAYNWLGNIAESGADFSGALKNHYAALKIRQEIGDKKGIGASYFNISNEFHFTGKYEESLSNNQLAIKYWQETGDKLLVADAQRQTGVIYLSRGNNQEALKILLEVLKVQQDFGDKFNMADKFSRAHTFTNLAIIYKNLADYKESLKYNEAALKIYEELDAKVNVANIYNNISNVYKLLGKYSEAMKYLLESLKIYEQTGSKGKIAFSYNGISEIFSFQGNFTEALRYLQQSLKIYRETNQKHEVAKILHNIGLTYIYLNDYNAAMESMNAALAIERDMGNKIDMAKVYSGIGRIYLEQENYKEALRYYFLSKNLAEETGDKAEMSNLYCSIGQTYAKLAAKAVKQDADQYYAEALSYLNNGLEMAKEHKAKGTIRNFYHLLASTCRDMKSYEKALQYYVLYMEMNDSLINSATTRKLEQQRTQYEVEKARAEERVQQEKALAEERIAGEKKLAEERLVQEKLLADERLVNEKRLADEKTRHELQAAEDKYLFELSLANERTEQERIKAEEQLKKEQALADEKYQSGQALAATKAKQEKEKAAIKRRNEMLLMGAGMLLILTVFVFLYLRQRTLKQRADERADAVHKMAELELQSLRAQLNPHFMFNSLNAIQELILMEDNERSHIYLSRFSKLIRMLLDNASQPFIPVKREIEFLELYLSLENLRIPDLQYAIETDPGIDVNNTSIPNMMLQPYMENAIWHGLSPKPGNKKLVLRIRRENGTILYEIEDNGIGRKKAAELKGLYRKEHKSKGMELLSKRFKLLNEEFGSEIDTKITDIADNGHAGGTKVSIHVPRQLSEKAKAILS